MRIVFDIEANGLENPTEIWCIVCKDMDTGDLHIFREVTKDVQERDRFIQFSNTVSLWVGHNALGYDLPVLRSLLGVDVLPENCIDTLIISKMADYPRKGEDDEKRKHSIEAYGEQFGYPKGIFSDFSKYSKEMEEYCVRDVEICHRVYTLYVKYITNPDYQFAIRTEHKFQLVANKLHDTGFGFDAKRARVLLSDVEVQLAEVDAQIQSQFPPKLKLIKEIYPRTTKYGTLNKSDFRFVTSGDLSIYNGYPFSRCGWVEFNAASPKQVVDVLREANWKPVVKTKTHIDTERELNRLKRSRQEPDPVAIKTYSDKLIELQRYGWKINEENLDTLPDEAPSSARLLARRILLESRRRTLTEWLGLVQPDGRIHGKFFTIGAWTHRMAHQNPNTANIPTELKILGKEMRSLWVAPRKRLLVGVDAESIQLRIFAHLINDAEFTKSLVSGKKEDKTDPHSMNQKIIGAPCRNGRKGSKNFIYAFFLGGGFDKLAFLLGCTKDEAMVAVDKMYERYPGLVYLREKIIPADAKRGWFVGLDGRPVKIKGGSLSERKHLALAGYLQSGETIVMRLATLKFEPKLSEYEAFLVNLVHDEWQTETPNDMKIALTVAKLKADALREVGEELKLNCPLAGSYWNDDHKDYTIGVNWYSTH